MLKNLIPITLIVCFASSCSTFRPATSQANTSQSTVQSDGNVQFITNISIKPDARTDDTHSSITTVNKDSRSSAEISGRAASAAAIENFSALQFKFAILENCSVEELDNAKLLSFMEYWYGAPYRYGGENRNGIDCSAFAFLLLSSVYGVTTLPRTSKEQYEASHHISRDQLQEGDLVFFHTLSGKKHRGVTHVGVYLRNNKFVHASVSGVMISDLADGYYDRHFIGAGRIPGVPSTSDATANHVTDQSTHYLSR